MHTELLAEAVEMATPSKAAAEAAPGDRLLFSALTADTRRVRVRAQPLVAESARASFERIEPPICDSIPPKAVSPQVSTSVSENG